MVQRPRILFISTMGGSPWGGSEELWSQAALELTKDADVIACVKRWPAPSPRIAQLESAGARIYYRTDSNTLLNRLLRNLTRRSVYDHCLETARPDLIVVSDGANLPPITLANSLLQRKIPYIHLTHSNSSRAFPRDDVADLHIKYFNTSVANLFVAQSHLDLLTRQLGASIKNTHIVRNPVNVSITTSTEPLAFDRSDRIVRFASVASLHPSSKGQDMLLSIFSKKEWQERQWALSLIGRGPHERALRRLSALFNLEARVFFRGYVDDISTVWKEHDILLMPSRVEGLPLAAVEAMLCGRPVIATDVGGMREIVEDGVTGFIAEAATEPFIEGALERAWERRNEWHEIGRKARNRAMEFITPDPVREFISLICKGRFSLRNERGLSDSTA